MTKTDNNTIITARSSHSLTTPRKANLILSTLSGKKATVVLSQLELLPQKAARIVAKVLKQAIANAGTNFSISSENLIVDSAFATKGRTIKRAHFGGRGHVKPYERTASHLTIRLRAIQPKPVVAKTVVPESVNSETTSPAKKAASSVKKTVKKTTK